MEQIIIFSLMISALYALVAMGFTMIFGVAGILNLAHGAFIMVSAYTAFVSQSFFHLDLYTSFAVAVGFTTLLAVAFYEGIHRFARIVFASAAGIGLYVGLTSFLDILPAIAMLIGLGAALGVFLLSRNHDGLIAASVIVMVSYLSLLCVIIDMPVLAAGLVTALVVALFLWLTHKQKLSWEHAIFFPLMTAVVAWAHFTMGKPVFESLLTGIPVGLLFTVGLVRYIQQSPVITLIVTLAMALLIEQLVIIFFRYDAQLLPPFIEGSVNLGRWLGQGHAPLYVPTNRLVLFVVSAIVIGLFWFFVQRTRTGKAILATSMDQAGAALVGIDVRKIYTLTWALSGALAGVAGVFLAAWLPMLPIMWRDPLIISFAIVVLGGLGSLKGSLLAAVMIGFIETLTAYTNPIHIVFNHPSNPFEQPYAFDLLGLSWVGVPSLIILVFILFLRPKGLFGREFE